jgi:ATP-GRASP peptide maturase of grasp-with-spasm system
MILIVCDSYEPSVDDVIDWLLFYEEPFFRINTSDVIDGVNLRLNSDGKVCIAYQYSGKEVGLDEISFYWYKRGILKVKHELMSPEVGNFGEVMDSQISWELFGIEQFLNSHLKKTPHINSFFDNEINKLEVLRQAQAFGLSIPDTLITSRRDPLLEFCNEHANKIISKSIRNGYFLESQDFKYYTHTFQINKDDIMEFPEQFVPALFQNMLDKKYELRIFYLDGVCYSSVIFSQNDPKTKIDFRNYNHQRPNRVCPFKLPLDIENKLDQLMKHLELASGSIDMVVTRNQEYVFLEVNPVGQFKQVSFPCNYKLEKLLATKISQKYGRETFKEAGNVCQK